MEAEVLPQGKQLGMIAIMISLTSYQYLVRKLVNSYVDFLTAYFVPRFHGMQIKNRLAQHGQISGEV